MKNLPVEIGRLRNLQSLDLSANHLVSLPTKIGELQNLQSLDLSGNHLASLPIEIGKLQNLQSLNLWGSELDTLPIDALKKMSNLKELNLGKMITYIGDRYGNPLSKVDIEALRQAMPWCEIIWKE